MIAHNKTPFLSRAAFLVIFAFNTVTVLSFTSCSHIKLAALEQLGYEKREILSSRITKARDAQEKGKEQFRSALDRFREAVKFDGGNLQEKYDILRVELDQSEESAEKIHQRVQAVKDVAKALFVEWEQELTEYTRSDLRRLSEAKLTASKRQYEHLVVGMDSVVKSMEPVLNLFRDHVLFFKHNLNARAIQSLRLEVPDIEREVHSLLMKMEKSIEEAEKFLASVEEK